MEKMTANMIQLEKEIAAVESDAIREENEHAVKNYSTLDHELEAIIKAIPYPDVERWTRSHDFDETEFIQWKKEQNRSSWEKRDNQKPYCDDGSLYAGHVNCNGGTDYFIMDHSLLETRQIGNVWLINADDKKWSNISKAWRYPDENKSVFFSRNIEMFNRHVSDVDVVLDKSNEALANITDAYLKKALIRNKNKSGVQSIIQTIQHKQDLIRSLPVTDSFAVQGCAGSGKTMVLLHRLRYLLYNKELHSEDYIFLVPSFRFKHFIKDISSQFRIVEKNIIPFHEYYQMLLGKDKDVSTEDINELVFEPKYLAFVYSKKFLQDQYQELFNILQSQANLLISFCEEILNSVIEQETTLVEEAQHRIVTDGLKRAQGVASEVIAFISKPLNNVSDISPFAHELREITQTVKKQKSLMEVSLNEITIHPDDERITQNTKLRKIKSEIDAEKLLIEKASIFTIRSHKNKLDKLQQSYTEAYAVVERGIIEQERKRLAQSAVQMSFVFEGITIETAEKIYEQLIVIDSEVQANLVDNQEKKENLDDYIGKKYQQSISALNEFIDLSATISDESERAVVSLSPSITFFASTIASGRKLASCFSKSFSAKQVEPIKMFAERTYQQTEAYLNTLLFNLCKRKIKNDFHVSICKSYKHYWYLALYCQYLTRDVNWKKSANIYIDECQDLSPSELELIYKINIAHVENGESSSDSVPTVNVFGDVNQTITSHGISSWNEIGFITQHYFLNENFRNPSQIIDYCNATFPFKMKQIGVDMDDVDEFYSVKQLIEKTSKEEIEKSVFVVKDDYAKDDLLEEIGKTLFEELTIYTVKEVKGLEFKSVIVIKREMSINECYIAFTRPLVKLRVINSLPHHSDTSKQLFIQGDESEEE